MTLVLEEGDSAVEWMDADDEAILGLLNDEGGGPDPCIEAAAPPFARLAPHVTPLITLEIELLLLNFLGPFVMLPSLERMDGLLIDDDDEARSMAEARGAGKTSSLPLGSARVRADGGREG